MKTKTFTSSLAASSWQLMAVKEYQTSPVRAGKSCSLTREPLTSFNKSCFSGEQCSCLATESSSSQDQFQRVLQLWCQTKCKSGTSTLWQSRNVSQWSMGVEHHSAATITSGTSTLSVAMRSIAWRLRLVAGSTSTLESGKNSLTWSIAEPTRAPMRMATGYTQLVALYTMVTSNTRWTRWKSSISMTSRQAGSKTWR